MKRILQIGLLAGGLLFFCTSLAFTQCLDNIDQTSYNSTFSGHLVIGQSFIGECNGIITFITIRSNSTLEQIDNVQLKIWEGNAIGGHSVVYIQNAITVNGKDVITQIPIGGGIGSNEIVLGGSYIFTVEHKPPIEQPTIDLELQYNGGVSLYPSGTAVKSDLSPTSVFDDLYFIIEADIATPVELTHFSAKLEANAKSVALDWSTASEIENRGFAIEKSMDGRVWQEVGFVSGAGNSDFIQQYNFTDKHPFFGSNYYRLKQMDYDGDFEYSPVEVVEVESNRPLEVYPNPAGTFVNIAITEDQIGESMLVLDAYGRMVHQVSALNSGINEIAIDHLPGGVYILQLSSGVSSRFVKTH